MKSIAGVEEVQPKIIASLCLQLLANEDKDYATSEVCKEIVQQGTFREKSITLTDIKSSFLLDFLSIGKLKYRELRRFLKAERVILSSYDKLSIFRQESHLVNEMKYLYKDPAASVGIFLPYQSLVSHSLQQLVEVEKELHHAQYPLIAKLSDGLDGSGSHRIYNQKQMHPDLTTKNFLLYAFKIIWLKDSFGNTLWTNPCPNSPFALRPVALLALSESEENVRFLMDSTINSETKYLKSNGIQTKAGRINIEITRCLFDTKMAATLDGAGGASCHLCTSTREQLKDVDLVQHGFPINRFIDSALQIFEEVNEDEFFSLPSKERFGISHRPTSEENILSASPLHGYLRVFSWFMQLIYHLRAGEMNWSPSSAKIRHSMEFTREFLWEKIKIRIDYPTSQGGTTSTGNVVRTCFQREINNNKDFLYWIATLIPNHCQLHVTTIYTNLSVILRIFNSDERIDNEKFSTLCKETYLLILIAFPWASITPTLHKVLAHSPQIIEEYNEGRSMKSFSEEGLEACHKYIRHFREQLARKTSFEANIQDIFTRLIAQSDYFSVTQRKIIGSKRNKKKPNLICQQQQLFDSMVIN